MTDTRAPRMWRRWPLAVLALVAVALYATAVLLYAGGLRGPSSACETIVPGDDPVTVHLQPAAVNAASQRLEFEMTLVPSKGLLSLRGAVALRQLPGRSDHLRLHRGGRGS